MADRSPRAADMSWSTPCLTVRDAEASLAFYVRAFGFEPGMSLRDKTGRVIHADMRYREQVFMLGPEDGEGCNARTPASSGVECPMSIYVYVDDVDAAHQRALEAGCKEGFPVQEMFWGDRCGQLIDLDGYRWMLATNVADFDPAKVPST